MTTGRINQVSIVFPLHRVGFRRPLKVRRGGELATGVGWPMEGPSNLFGRRMFYHDCRAIAADQTHKAYDPALSQGHA